MEVLKRDCPKKQHDHPEVVMITISGNLGSDLVSKNLGHDSIPNFRLESFPMVNKKRVSIRLGKIFLVVRAALLGQDGSKEP
jgi:hypothetical protein